MTDQEKLVTDYIACALWSSSAYVDMADDGTTTPNPESDTSFSEHNFDASDLAPTTLAAMRADVAEFHAANRADCDAWEAAGHSVGHDFWLTRNGHGAGFWDRYYDGSDMAARGKRLTAASTPYGEVSLYLDSTFGVIYADLAYRV